MAWTADNSFLQDTRNVKTVNFILTFLRHKKHKLNMYSRQPLLRSPLLLLKLYMYEYVYVCVCFLVYLTQISPYLGVAACETGQNVCL